jgi:peptide/nickel transport system permease protein
MLVRTRVLAAVPIATASATALLWHAGGEPWAPPNARHLLGLDEFGRDLLAATLASVLRSALDGALLALAVLLLGLGSAGYLTLRTGNKAAVGLLLSGTRTLEAVPLLIWVLAGAAVAAEMRWFGVAVVFVIAALPATAHVIAAEVERQRDLPYVEAAQLLGVGPLRILCRHMLPNSGAVLVPLSVQLAGAAIAINGAVGLLGMGNRSELDVGVLLLRAKENVWLQPRLMTAALASFAALYAYLWLVQRVTNHRNEDAPIDSAG